MFRIDGDDIESVTPTYKQGNSTTVLDIADSGPVGKTEKGGGEMRGYSRQPARLGAQRVSRGMRRARMPREASGHVPNGPARIRLPAARAAGAAGSPASAGTVRSPVAGYPLACLAATSAR